MENKSFPLKNLKFKAMPQILNCWPHISSSSAVAFWFKMRDWQISRQISLMQWSEGPAHTQKGCDETLEWSRNTWSGIPNVYFQLSWKRFPRKWRRTRSSFSGCLLIYCYKDDLRWWILVIVILQENDRDKVSLDIVIRSTWLSGNHKKSLGSEDISSEVYFSFPNRYSSPWI